MARPKPVVTKTICSECGLDWALHTKGRKTEPTPDVCIRLLKDEVQSARSRQYYSGITNCTSTGTATFGISL